ncbi:MAG: dolichyl-phosphate beta-glucosyltransferase [Thermoanaerobaculia bacterium]
MSAQLRDPPVWLSVVIPAYNEADRLVPTLQRVSTYLSSRSFAFEILVVDDGSCDATLAVAGSFATAGVRPLRLSENRGKGAALKNGVLQSRGRYVLLCDADLSTPIEEMEKLEALTPEVDLILGSRALESSDILCRQPHYREWMGKVFNLMLRTGGIVHQRDTQCGFKLIEGSVARGLFELVTTRGFAFDVELVWLADRLGVAVAEVGVVWRDSSLPSKVRPWRDPITMMLEVAGFLVRHSFGVRPLFVPRAVQPRLPPARER